jgi:RNA polymerase sigma-70 factor (ECF subfamily)
VAPALSFERVYRDGFAFVWSTLLRLGVPRAAVEDATQDVFVVVHRRLADFEGRGSGLRSWLFTIVRRVAYRHRRGAERTERKLRALAGVGTRPAELEEVVDRRLTVALVFEALDELDFDKRVALDLHVFEGLTGPQIASVLEIKLETAYSRIKAARQGLERSLAARGVRGDPARVMAMTREGTRPPRGARRKVAAALALRLDLAGAGVAGATAGLKIALAVALGGATALGMVARGTLTPVHAPAAIVHPQSGEPDGSRGAPESKAPSIDAPLAPAAAELRAATAAAPPEPPDPPRPRDGARAESPAAKARVEDVPTPSAEPAAALAAEVDLITRAKRSLQSDPAQSLRLLATHAERFADGQLATERAGYRAIALCALGRRAEGTAEARLFVAVHGGGSLARRVERECEIPERGP